MTEPSDHELILQAIPDDSPFKPEHFRREDETGDDLFYTTPRMVTHIDEAAIGALGAYYSTMISEADSVLDLMSSWISHYPADVKPARMAGLGMNAEELAANPQLSEWTVHNLNKDPILPYDDASFDAVTVAVSVQYLQRPIPVFQEIARVLRPTGKCIISFSNRCFPTKAIGLWLGTNAATHLEVVGAYFHLAGGFEPPEAADLSPNSGASDPLYAVFAVRSAGPGDATTNGDTVSETSEPDAGPRA